MANSDKAKKNFDDIRESNKETFEYLEKMSKEFPDIINYAKRLAASFGDAKNFTKEQLDLNKKTNDITREILGNRRNIHKESFATKDLDELSAEFAEKGLKNRKAILQVLKQEQRIQKSINNQINAGANAAKKIGDNITSGIQNIPFIGNFASTFLGLDNLGEDMAKSLRNVFSSSQGSSFGRDAGAEFTGSFFSNFFRGSGKERTAFQGLMATLNPFSGAYTEDEVEGRKKVRSFFGSILGVRKGGTGISNLFRVFGTASAVIALTAFAKAFSQGLFAYNFDNFLKTFVPGFTAFKDTFGDISKFSATTAFNLGRSRLFYSIQAEDALKLAKAQTTISGLSVDQALAQQRTTAQLARQRGVAPADVIKDLAENSELIAEYTSDGGKNLSRAAIDARKLGMSLSTTAKIADSLLNFESSIEGELEASLMIGRQLNLNKARELALMGDMEALQKEIVRQVGSEQALQNMNVVTRKSFAGALGISVQELNKLAQGGIQFGSNDLKENTLAMKILKGVVITAIGGTLLAVISKLVKGFFAILGTFNRNTIATDRNTGALVRYAGPYGGPVYGGPGRSGGGGIVPYLGGSPVVAKGKGVSFSSGTRVNMSNAIDMVPGKDGVFRQASKTRGLLGSGSKLLGSGARGYLPLALLMAGSSVAMAGEGNRMNAVKSQAGSLGGAAVGATIGSMIAPGIGTIIGGTLGSMIGSSIASGISDSGINENTQTGILSELKLMRRDINGLSDSI